MYEYSWYMINTYAAVGFIRFDNGLSTILHQAIKWVNIDWSAVRSRCNNKKWDAYMDENTIVVTICNVNQSI